ncbi:MAG TPA: hypothetical protein VFT32_06125 [Candidatus Eisenbacteria bacterium]|nr:hypothetical protein [Candidatus Eisenbacteria bacterium]
MRRAIRIRAAGPVGFMVWGFMLAAVVAALWPAVGRASIPDADIRAGYNEAGFGVGNGAFGRLAVGLSERGGLGMYVGTDPNDVYFSDFGPGDRDFDSDLVVGGHYMHQFLEGNESRPSIAGVFGAFANRSGMRPELGLATSYAFAPRWVGRANFIYGPSWGLEVGYRFTPTVEGTFGVTGMGLVGLGLRF